MEKVNVILPKNKPISNIELEAIAKKNGIPLNGVLMKDELTELRVGNYIINLNDSDQDGSHWTCLIVGPTDAVYWDSFGAPPPQNIHDLVREYFPRVNFNNFIVQNIKNESCGYYVIVLLLYLQKHKHEQKSLLEKVNDYTNHFVDDSTKNYGILKQLAKSLSK